MLLDGLRQKVTLGDLALFIFGVTGDADDLHAVHQRTRDVERVRRGDEHHVGQVVFYLKVVIHEGRVLLWVQHLKHCR
ncbi:hypothetical protein D3C80_1216390 [compost metagenome]